MGRRKIEIQPITHERNRSVTFLKRKNGLFKKAYELGVLCSVDVAVIIFEERQGHHVKLFEYCSGDIDNMVQRHIHFDGEKDARGPMDFNNKQDDGGDDDDDGDDDDGVGGGKRRDSLNKGPKLKREGGKMIPVKSGTGNLGLNMDMEYGSDPSRQMGLPHQLQIPRSAPVSNPSPSSYSSSGLPVSLERHTSTSPNVMKKPRIAVEPGASQGYPYGLDDSAGSAHSQSPSYRINPQLFPGGPGSGASGHSGGGGGGGGSGGAGGNPGSPNSQFFTPGLGFSRSQGGGQQARGPSSGFPPPSYAPTLYPPPNPFSTLIGGSTSGHGTQQHSGYDPIDWPVHHSSAAAADHSHARATPHQTSSQPSEPFPPRPQSQPVPQPGPPPNPGDNYWLDFLSGQQQAAGTGTNPLGQGLTGAGTGQPPPSGRRLDDSWERGQGSSSTSPTQPQKRPRSDSMILGGGGGGGGGKDDVEGRGTPSESNRRTTNGTAHPGKETDQMSDGSGSATGDHHKKQRLS